MSIKAIVANDTSLENHHGCDVVMRGIYQLCQKNNIDIVGIIYAGMTESISYATVDSVDFDVFIINGEGTLHHSQPRALFLAGLIYRVLKKNKRVVIVNATVQDNNDYILEALRGVESIYVREISSFEYLRSNGISSKVIPDMSFYAEYYRQKDCPRSGVAITDSVFLDLSERLFNFSKENSFDFLPILRPPRIEFNNIKNALRIVKYSARRVLSLAGFGRYSMRRLKYYKNDYESYIDAVAGLSFLVTARFHSMCFSIKTQTPFVVISSNTYKMQSLLDEIGISASRVVLPDSLEALDFWSIPEFSSDELNSIRQYCYDARGRIESVFDSIANNQFN